MTFKLAYISIFILHFLCAAKNLAAAPVSSTGKMVFAHFMLAYPTGNDQVADYFQDVTRAYQYGIDGFALNMGSLPEDEAHNEYLLRADKIYQAAQQSNTGFKLFISVDTTSLVNTTLIQHVVTRYASYPNQLFYGGKQFLSTFLGQSAPFNWQADVLNPLSASKNPVYFLPNFVGDPHTLFSQYPFINGNLKWIPMMDSDPLSQDLSEDNLFRQYSSQAGKTYMQGIGPWFYCGLSWKNSGNSEDGQIFVDKWENTLTNNPDFVELVTWNDFSESTYLAPPNSPVIQQSYPWGSLSHDALLDLSSYYHQAFKTGTRPKIIEDKVYYYYRTHSKNAVPSNPGPGIPSGGAQEDDFIYAVSMLTAPGTVVITSGSSTKSFNVGAGINKLSMPFMEGQQSVALQRNGGGVLQSTGQVQISNNIQVYNFNIVAYVATPATGITPGGVYEVKVGGGRNGCFTYLSTAGCSSATPNLVDMYSNDDGSGRQRWQFNPVPGKANTYNLQIINGRNGCNGYLSAIACNGNPPNLVDMYGTDDGSGRQQWILNHVPGTSLTFNVRNVGRSGCNQYLSCASCGSNLVDLFGVDDGSGRQQWVLTAV